jgi:hypothetical protein
MDLLFCAVGTLFAARDGVTNNLSVWTPGRRSETAFAAGVDGVGVSDYPNEV